MTGGAKNICTIDPGIPFVDALARGIAARIAKDDPMALARVHVLLPTRRAVRSLREAFLRTGAGTPMLLPRMTPLGDVDEDDILLAPLAAPEAEGAGGERDDLPPVIGGLRRQLLLSRLVMTFGSHGWGGAPDAGQAAELALELARLLDQMETERIDFSVLGGLVSEENLAAHWQKTLDFLEILTEHWPRVLAAEGAIGPADYRNRLLRARARVWKNTPPADWVIAAGSTGSIPATADLLDVVASLERGLVVLPGLDRDMDDGAWRAIGESHPQFTMARLLDHCGVVRGDVRDFGDDWPFDLDGAPSQARSRLLARALSPVPGGAAFEDGALENLTWVDCPQPAEEAGVIALLMRGVLEEKGKTAALVTPDRALARRVASRLRRWDIEIDDSAGTPLGVTPVAVFFELLAEMVASRFSPVAVLSCLKHPFACGGEDRAGFRAKARILETHVLRGPRPAPGSEGIKARIKAARDACNPETDGETLAGLEQLAAWFDGIAEMLSPLARAMAGPSLSLGALVDAHIAAAEALAAGDDETGASRLWRGDDGEALATFFVDLRASLAGFPDLDGKRYRGLLSALLVGRVVRPRFGRHPRLFIWGPLEARLQHADMMILGGLNEASWPPDVGNDPWMSRPMRKAMGLPQPERRIGLAAHDFVQAFGAPQVVLTRSERVDGTPQVASRWLLRLANVLGAARVEELKKAGGAWLAQVAALDGIHGIGTAEQKRPEPKPPLGARPRRLSVTEIETLQTNPYAIYARHVLRLRPLDAIDADAGAAERGSFIHEALQNFVENWPDSLPEGGRAGAVAALLDIGHEIFAPLRATPGFYALWWPRFERIAHWFVDQEIARRERFKTLAVERRGELSLAAPGGAFTLSGLADRIDQNLADDGIAIIDYKTGATPSVSDQKAGFAPQLPLLAALAEAGAFGLGDGAVRLSQLEYWRLSGGDPAGKRETFRTESEDCAGDALRGLQHLIALFDNESCSYAARPVPGHEPRFDDYAHLARVREWSGSGDGDGD